MKLTGDIAKAMTGTHLSFSRKRGSRININAKPWIGIPLLKKWIPAFAGMTILFTGLSWPEASEVLPKKTNTQVLVRQHPRTGRPFVSLSSNQNAGNPFLKNYKMMKRPDYRMLDPKIKPKDVGYEGPSSDRKKVYILAASLATIGTVGGSAIIAAAPAATGAGAAGGAGAFGAAGGAVAAGAVSTAVISTRPPDPEKQNYEHRSESHAVTSEPAVEPQT